MAEFTEVMKQRERMCDVMQHNCASCENCGLYGTDMTCNSFMIKYPQTAEALIMKWAEEHPIKTNADKFKEVFGEQPGTCAFICVDNCTESTCSKCKYKDFWNQEYKEPKEV